MKFWHDVSWHFGKTGKLIISKNIFCQSYSEFLIKFSLKIFLPRIGISNSDLYLNMLRTTDLGESKKDNMMDESNNIFSVNKFLFSSNWKVVWYCHFAIFLITFSLFSFVNLIGFFFNSFIRWLRHNLLKNNFKALYIKLTSCLLWNDNVRNTKS